MLLSSITSEGVEFKCMPHFSDQCASHCSAAVHQRKPSERALYLYCFGSLGDLMISRSPTLSSPPPSSAAARLSSREAGASAWTEPGESAAGLLPDLFVCGILGRGDEALAQRTDSRARLQTTGQLAVTGNLVVNAATRRVSQNRAMMKTLRATKTNRNIVNKIM